MIDAFDLPAIGRSAARFDFAKLENLNGHYIRHADDQSLVTMFERRAGLCPRPVPTSRPSSTTPRAAQLLQAMPSLKERAKTLIELIDSAYFIFADRPLEIEPKAAALLTPETRELIGQTPARAGGRHDVDRGNHRSGDARISPKPTTSSSARWPSHSGWR